MAVPIMQVRIRQAHAGPPGEARIMVQRGTLLAVSGQALTLFNTSNLLWSKGPDALLQDTLPRLAEEIGLQVSFQRGNTWARQVLPASSLSMPLAESPRFLYDT